MRLPRFRLTVRGMMVAVVIVAAPLTYWRIGARRQVFQGLAAHHRVEEQKARQFVALTEKNLREDVEEYRFWRAQYLKRDPSAEEVTAFLKFRSNYDGPSFDEFVADGRRSIDHFTRLGTLHGRLVAKYERAARSPWLPVAPDPPEPE